MKSQQLAKGFKRMDERTPRPWAWVVFVFIAVVSVSVLYPVFSQQKESGGTFSPISNLKQVTVANLIYANDHDDRLPIAATWMDALLPYIKNEKLFVDPLLVDPKKGEYGFAFFKPLSGIEYPTVLDPETVPLVFESKIMNQNAASNLSTLPSPPRYKGTHMIGFLDGHAKSFKDKDVDRNVKIELKPSTE